MLRFVMLACAWLACILGCIGIFIPVLPTTPLLLLATFLFAKSSPRLHAWIRTTKVYQSYVLPFKEAGGLTWGAKIRILVLSYALMGLSAFFVQRWYVWLLLGLVALFLLYLMFLRIPTVSKNELIARSVQNESEDQS